MKHANLRKSGCIAAGIFCLAFFAACGDLETFHGRLVGRDPFPWMNLSRGTPTAGQLALFYPDFDREGFNRLRTANIGTFFGWVIIGEISPDLHMKWIARGEHDFWNALSVLEEVSDSTVTYDRYDITVWSIHADNLSGSFYMLPYSSVADGNFIPAMTLHLTIYSN